MEAPEREKITKALRTIEQRLTHALHGPPMEGTDQGTAYLVNQVRAIRALLAEHDPTVAVLFPELPDGLSLAELAIIAGQLAEYASENGEAAPARGVGSLHGQERTVNLTVSIGDGVVFGEEAGEGIGGLIKSAVEKAAQEAGADCMNVSIDIGDGVVFSVPKLDGIGEMTRKAVKKAMEGLSGCCEDGERRITVRMDSGDCRGGDDEA